MSEATSALPARQIGGFANLLAALDHAAAFDELGHTWFQGSGKQEAALSYAQLQQQSDACAERLRQAAPGLQPGARVGIVAATGPWFLATFCACAWAWCPARCPCLHRCKTWAVTGSTCCNCSKLLA